MELVYFDVNVISQLLCPGGVLTRYRDDVKWRIETNELAVFGSAALVEELAGLSLNSASEYAALMNDVLDLVGPYFLTDRKFLCQSELRVRRPLCIIEAVIDYFDIRKIRQEAVKQPFAKDLHAEVCDRKQRDHDWLQVTAAEITKKCATLGVTQGMLQREARSADWRLSNDQIASMAHRLSTVSHAIGSTGPGIEFACLPVLASWLGYILAAAHRNQIDGAQWTESDRYDQEHYAYAAVAGVLVTDDKALRKIASLIETPRVVVRSSNDYFHSQ